MNVEQKKFWMNIAILAAVAIAAIWLNLPLGEHSKEEKTSKANGLDGDYILALSWQPAFCEQKPNKPECRSQRQGRFDTQNLSLHGLWPQPKNNIYCDPDFSQNSSWSRLPKLDLSSGVRQELEEKMPGSRSFLHRHEWAKHGTCAEGMSEEEYFNISFDLMDAINASPLRKYITDNIGKEISLSNVSTIMERAFGKGAGERVRFFCNRDGRRNLISEIWISLKSQGGNNLLPLAQHIVSAERISSRCKSGVIDPVGLQ